MDAKDLPKHDPAGALQLLKDMFRPTPVASGSGASSSGVSADQQARKPIVEPPSFRRKPRLISGDPKDIQPQLDASTSPRVISGKPNGVTPSDIAANGAPLTAADCAELRALAIAGDLRKGDLRKHDPQGVRAMIANIHRATSSAPLLGDQFRRLMRRGGLL